jgi:hypothetical protein
MVTVSACRAQLWFALSLAWLSAACGASAPPEQSLGNQGGDGDQMLPPGSHVDEPDAATPDVHEQADSGEPAPDARCGTPCDTGEACEQGVYACDVPDAEPRCVHDGFVKAGTVCRASDAPCDAPETCSGSDAPCPPDAFADGSVVCRKSAGDCDLPEYCTGETDACPEDALADVTVVCREQAGTCDVSEHCSGSSPVCPSDQLAEANSVCRASAGPCDAVEVCSGDAAACPADAFATASTLCRANAGSCDVAEYCTGASATCPINARLDSAVICRASTGDCDVAEHCTGTLDGCPADELAHGTVCRAAVGACDVAETCNGSSKSCPEDALAAAGTSCRASDYACDAAELCTGESSECPVDLPAAETTACGCGDGQCGADAACDGPCATYLSFDGTDDFVSVPGLPALGTTDFTVEAMVYLPDSEYGAAYTDYWTVFSSDATGSGHAALVVSRQADDLRICASRTDSSMGCAAPVSFATHKERWFHVSLINTTTGSRVRLIGPSSATSVSVSPADLGGINTRWGDNASTTFSPNNFLGRIANARIWQRALTEQQLTALASGDPPADTTGLLHAWSFDEGTGQTVVDSVAALNGTLGASSAAESSDPAWGL